VEEERVRRVGVGGMVVSEEEARVGWEVYQWPAVRDMERPGGGGGGSSSSSNRRRRRWSRRKEVGSGGLDES